MTRETSIEEMLRAYKFRLVSQNKHLKYRDPEGRIFIRSKTPSDWRTERNMVASLRRIGSAPRAH
jgi:hypothetical protein